MTFLIQFSFASALLFAALLAVPLQSSGNEVRSSLDRLIETRKLISEEETQWRTEREGLEKTIELIERELSRLADDIELTEEESAAAEMELSRLGEQNEALLEITNTVEHRIGRTERALPGLFASFPEPLRDRTRPLLARREPGENNVPAAPLAQRAQAMVGFLGEADRFQENIRAVREFVSLDGDETEVRVLYIGLGQAYYLSSEGNRAGIGSPGDDGWEWTPRNDAAASIRRAFAVYDLETAPEFIRLPVAIQNR